MNTKQRWAGSFQDGLEQLQKSRLVYISTATDVDVGDPTDDNTKNLQVNFRILIVVSVTSEPFRKN